MPICSVQSLSHVQLFATPWTAACQTSLSIINSLSLLKLMSIESVMPSNHRILGRPLLLLPSVFPCIEVFSKGVFSCSMWDIVPQQGIEPTEFNQGLNSLHWEHRVLATRPPGKSPGWSFSCRDGVN